MQVVKSNVYPLNINSTFNDAIGSLILLFVSNALYENDRAINAQQG